MFNRQGSRLTRCCSSYIATAIQVVVYGTAPYIAVHSTAHCLLALYRWLCRLRQVLVGTELDHGCKHNTHYYCRKSTTKFTSYIQYVLVQSRANASGTVVICTGSCVAASRMAGWTSFVCRSVSISCEGDNGIVQATRPLVKKKLKTCRVYPVGKWRLAPSKAPQGAPGNSM